MTLTYGALCAGYGGLEMGVQAAIPGRLAWYAETDPAPASIMAAHHPGVPNLGDMTRIDWSSVEPVAVITGGTPCQDLSTAGKRKGMTDGTRSNLWVEMREAVAVLRPRLVVWENVRGALSAVADSALEPCAGCVGDRDGRPFLRALGRVLGDLADLGYDARWHGLRAADVGAPHGRFRVFVFAVPTADADLSGLGIIGRVDTVQCDADRRCREDRARDEAEPAPLLTLLPSSLLPTPRSSDSNGAGAHGEGGPDLRTAVTLLPTPVADNSRGIPSSGTDFQSLPNAVCALLPTPAVNDMGEGKTVESWDEWTGHMKTAHGNGNGHGASLAIEAQRLLPSPRATDGTKGGPNQRGSSGDLMLPSAVRADQWGKYAAAIARWETVVGRPSPEPTEPGRSGPRLSPLLVEWMMGLPEGHVTGRGLSRPKELQVLGNGVVPQQAEAATRAWLADIRAEVAA